MELKDRSSRNEFSVGIDHLFNRDNKLYDNNMDCNEQLLKGLLVKEC